MVKEKNPRRVVLSDLRQVKRWASEMVSTWDQSMVRYDPSPRKVRPEEKRENSADRWAQLIQFMDAIIFRASEIRQFAIERQGEVEGGKQW